MPTGKRRVIFSYPAPEAGAVFLCGSFNAWDPARTPMRKSGDGTWKAVVMLEPGRYEYRVVVDGQWKDDPAAETLVPNGLGGVNCVRSVGAPTN